MTQQTKELLEHIDYLLNEFEDDEDKDYIQLTKCNLRNLINHINDCHWKLQALSESIN